VSNVQSGARVTAWAKGSVNNSIGTAGVTLTRNGTALDFVSTRTTVGVQNVPFSLINYNDSATAGDWLYNITKQNVSLNLANTKIIVRVET
jgi:hypothetical protein